MRDITVLLQKIIRQIRETKTESVRAVHIALGELSELDPSDLRAQWTDLTKNTTLEHAQLHLRLIPAEVQCMACFQKYRPIDKKIHCPSCGSFGAKILKGEECSLDSIEAGHDQD